MPFRKWLFPGIFLVFLAIVAGSFAYGPAQRRFVVPDRTIALRSAGEIENLWRSTAVHGRIAVLFTRHLNKQLMVDVFPETDYLDISMKRGVVRTAFYVVPDRFWSNAVSEILHQRELFVPLRRTAEGYILQHVGGRIYIMPLSKYIPEQDREKALVVIESTAWTQEEQSRIKGFLSSQQLPADLVVIIDGTH